MALTPVQIIETVCPELASSPSRDAGFAQPVETTDKGFFEIYKVTTPTGRTYYGQHLNRVYPKDDGYRGSGKAIKFSIAKYGKKAHKKEILQVVDSQWEADELERAVIKLLGDETCINIAEGGHAVSFTGMRHDEEALRRISEAAKKQWQEARPRMVSAHEGQVPWHKGKKLDEKHINLMCRNQKGIPNSPETRKRISMALKGKPKSPATREAMVKAWEARKQKAGQADGC
jgi:hypothetical protein